jgi:hypothetical protein
VIQKENEKKITIEYVIQKENEKEITEGAFSTSRKHKKQKNKKQKNKKSKK